MKATPKVEILIDMTNPILELEQVISFVLSNQNVEQQKMILESLNKSIVKALESVEMTPANL